MAAGESEQALRAYVEYLRDLGVYDFYRHGEPVYAADLPASQQATAVAPAQPVLEHPVVGDAPKPAVMPVVAAGQEPAARAASPMAPPVPSPPARPVPAAPVMPPAVALESFQETAIPKPVSFNELAPLPTERLASTAKPAALAAIQEEIGDCTRCPLAYAGRNKIVFADGDSNARLMFVGEGPGADEDAQGLPFVGKAGQLLNNMINAMGVTREQVYIANIVKCRPPANRTPEPIEATTCSQFLLKQIDVVQPEVIVALGSTAATYLLGVKQSLSGLRGRWHSCRGAKLAVTYHPAFLLRDPRQKAEAWKDLQMVMKEMGLKPPSRG
ncbi:MAG: uracil-DNA glycosylase [Edaphobacter sp.]|uniref:uracil-DNA glycosylase n=1 Tax=Edaphobacter sp. TaxID=1934404 RepID=UPI00239339AE|nr:uracil-DNA glycosylase [Edaphobacter sp.]MDE1177589.1 uracil-DNA glycosylase [Edaphobacter sp.]